MALFTHAAKLDPRAHGGRCARAKAVHYTVLAAREIVVIGLAG